MYVYKVYVYYTAQYNLYELQEVYAQIYCAPELTQSLDRPYVPNIFI